MNKEILLIVESISNEKELSKETIFLALEEALALAARKQHSQAIEARVKIDQRTGDYETFRLWRIVESVDQIENPDADILLQEAQKKNPKVNIGDTLEETMPSVEFGRIAVQTAKHIIMQKMREAERSKVADHYRSKLNDVLAGTVRRVTRDALFVELNKNAEAILKREDLLPREIYHVGDRIRACLIEIRPESRGIQLVLSRTHPNVLRRLFELEVPEIAEEVILIKSVARDPGSRSKMAVKTNDGRIDPIGACIGIRGTRVQAVSEELGGERVDIILWNDNPAQFIINAMAPAAIESVVIDEEKHSMDIAVSEENLAQAIGRNGQNVRLASQLSGWELNVMSTRAAQEKTEIEQNKIKTLFIDQLGMTETLAATLVSNGFSSIEEIAYAPEKELLLVLGEDQAASSGWREKAKEVLLKNALAEDIDDLDDLLNVEGMTPEIALALARQSIKTQDDLAEQSVDDLIDLIKLEEKKAGELIMAARAKWFKKASF